MDKRFLDPRRPKGALTADEKLEMLPPYAEELPFTASLYASHKEAIEGLKSMLVSCDSCCTQDYSHIAL